jgi:hypothetical protein
MSTLQIAIVLLGGITATVLLALGWAFLAIAKRHDEQADLPCCYRPDIKARTAHGVTAPYCWNCGIWQRSPLEAATTSSPGTMDRGALVRPTEERSDAA